MNPSPMVRGRRLSRVFVAVALLASGETVRAASSADTWRQTVSLYGIGAAIEGDTQIGNLAVPVDISSSDLFDALDFGGMITYRIENQDWSFAADLTYMDLGWSGMGPRGQIGASLDVEQLTLMASVGRKLTPELEVLFSLAYFDVSARAAVSATSLDQAFRAQRDASWVDPLVGLRYAAPIGGKWDFQLRGEVGGFGVGSDLTVHGLAALHHRTSERFGWFVGYRYIGYDYEDGSGSSYQHYDLRQHGPAIGVMFGF